MRVIILSAVAVKYLDFDALRHACVPVSLIYDQREVSMVSETIRAACASTHEVTCEVSRPGPVAELTYEAVLPVVKKLLATESNSAWRLATFNDMDVLLAARLSAELGLPSLSEAQLQLYHDKLSMKERLDAHGIRTPHHLLLDVSVMLANPAAYYDRIVAKTGVPFILKPIDSAGSFGVVRIDAKENFVQWVDCVREKTLTFEAEEFIDGMLYHCDSAIENGKTIFSECCEYTFPNMEFKNNKVLSSIVLPATHPVREKLATFVERVLCALGKINTVSHMEVFVKKNGECVFLEVGARPPGAMSQQMYHYDTGVSLTNLYLRVLFGIPYAPFEQSRRHSFWAYFPRVAGKITACVPPTLQSPYEVCWRVRVGETLTDSRSIAEPSGTLFVTNQDFAVLYQDFNWLRHYQPLLIQ